MVDLSGLMARIRRGEIGALEALYRCEAPRLIALAAHLTADRPAAEDIVHDVFCALWRDPDAVGHQVREYLVGKRRKARAGTHDPQANRQRREDSQANRQRREIEVRVMTNSFTLAPPVAR